ncbi:MAG: hypothetical protein Q9172_006068 [Xanthocarpia lactea]
MAGLWPKLHHIKHFDRDILRAVENEGWQWLQKYPGSHGFSSMPLEQQLAVYRILCGISTPEFINVKIDAREGVWRIPFVFTSEIGGIAGIALSMIAVDHSASGGLRNWSFYGEGVGIGSGDIFLKGPLFPQEFEALVRGEFPSSLSRLGKLGHGLPPVRLEGHLDQLAGRPSTGPNRADFYDGEYGIIAQTSPPQLPGHPMDHYVNLGMERRIAPMARRPPRQVQPARRPPTVPIQYTGNISDSSSGTTDSTATESESESESEVEAPRKPTKSKSTKSRSTKRITQGKSGLNPKRKTERRRQSSSGSDNEDDAPKQPKKSDNRGKPKGKPPRRGRSPSDDGIAPSADERQGKTKAKQPARRSIRGRGRSDDEEEPSPRDKRRPAPKNDLRALMLEGKGQGPSIGNDPKAPEQRPRRRNRGRNHSDDESRVPTRGKFSEARGQQASAAVLEKGPSKKKVEGLSSGKAGKVPEGRAGVTDRGRCPSEDEGPPPMDPVEQAKLDALKARNGYGQGY